MKNPIYYLSILICFAINPIGIQAQTQLDADSLDYEFGILEEVLNTLHPGLYRFKDSLNIHQFIAKQGKKYKQSKNLQEAFLHLNALTNHIQCGHTYPNYWNQKKSIQNALFNKADKLPFTFVIVENALLIRQNLSSQKIAEGSLITAINGVSSKKIIQKLLAYSRADGNNTQKRLIDLSIHGQGKFEAFDILFPMLFPPKNASYDLKLKNTQGNQEQITVKTISRSQRIKSLKEKYNIEPTKAEDRWAYKDLDKNTAYLKLGTFSVWNFEMDWKAYLQKFFKSIHEKQSQNLIIDIRGNEGGLMEVYWKLFTYLTDKPLNLLRDKQLIRYSTVPQELRPFLSSWEPNLADIGNKVQKKDARFYKFKDTSLDTLHIDPAQYPFTGNLIILIDAANSSATYYLAKFIQQNQLGTLIGQTTGGNLMGTNGGKFFMLRLPYTRLEVDIPLIGYFPLTPQDNQGLKPDYLVDRNIEFYTSDEDLDIQKALEILKK